MPDLRQHQLAMAILHIIFLYFYVLQSLIITYSFPFFLVKDGGVNPAMVRRDSHGRVFPTSRLHTGRRSREMHYRSFFLPCSLLFSITFINQQSTMYYGI